MAFVTALMFAFNSVIFSPDIRQRVDQVGIMAALVGIATFFIVIMGKSNNKLNSVVVNN